MQFWRAARSPRCFISPPANIKLPLWYVYLYMSNRSGERFLKSSGADRSRNLYSYVCERYFSNNFITHTINRLKKKQQNATSHQTQFLKPVLLYASSSRHDNSKVRFVIVCFFELPLQSKWGTCYRHLKRSITIASHNNWLMVSKKFNITQIQSSEQWYVYLL